MKNEGENNQIDCRLSFLSRTRSTAACVNKPIPTACLITYELPHLRAVGARPAYQRLEPLGSDGQTRLPNAAEEANALESNTSARIHDGPFRADVFADGEELALWLPRVHDDASNSRRVRWSKRSRTLLLQLGMVGAVLVVHTGLAVLATSYSEGQNGVGLLSHGDGDTVNRLDQGLRLLTNLFSTGMLSASNFFMQLQVAPT